MGEGFVWGTGGQEETKMEIAQVAYLLILDMPLPIDNRLIYLG